MSQNLILTKIVYVYKMSASFQVKMLKRVQTSAFSEGTDHYISSGRIVGFRKAMTTAKQNKPATHITAENGDRLY